MTAIDDLLAQSLLLQDPRVPPDTVPYEDTAYPAMTAEGLFLWDHGPDLADDLAAQDLHALCEAAIAHCGARHLADFITDQLPAPRVAWTLGCVLRLADATDGARFWWQYAAGAGEAAASYCLYLHHRSEGDTYAAEFWHKQSGADSPERDDADQALHDCPADTLGTDTSVPTVLRILTQLAPGTPREHTETASAVIAFVSTAVAIGYDRNPDYEIPLPGPDFAAHLAIIVAATSAPRSPRRRTVSPSGELPSRSPVKNVAGGAGPSTPQESTRLLVEVQATDSESASAFYEAVPACWERAEVDHTGGMPGDTGTRLHYYLESPPLTQPPRAACTRPRGRLETRSQRRASPA